MKAKKLATLGLASALCMSLASPAFASTTKITSTYKDIKIDVVVPTTGTATINPFGLPVKIQSTEETPKNLITIQGQKITTVPMAIYSKTETGLLVNATVSAELGRTSTMELVNSIPAGSTSKSVVMYLETMTSALDETYLAKTGDAASQTALGPFEAWDSVASAVDEDVVGEVEDWAATTYSATARNQVLVSTDATTKNAIGYLSAADDTWNLADDGTLTEVNETGTPAVLPDGKMDLQPGGAMWFRLAGDVVSTPDEAWTSKDSVTVTVAFTFIPTDSAGAPGKIDNNTATANTAKAFSIVDIDASNPKMTFANATYKWEVTSKPSGGSASFSTTAGEKASDPTPKITFSAAGKYMLQVTVTENNVPYVATQEVSVS